MPRKGFSDSALMEALVSNILSTKYDAITFFVFILYETGKFYSCMISRQKEEINCEKNYQDGESQKEYENASEYGAK